VIKETIEILGFGQHMYGCI